MNIYLTEPGMILRKKGGTYIVEKEGINIKSIPSKLVESISVYSGATITSKCIGELINNNVYIFWYNSINVLTGYVESFSNNRSEEVIKQVEFLKELNVRLEISKKIISAKLHNGIVVLKRFNRTRNSIVIDECINNINSVINQIDKQKSIRSLYGIEGIGSKEYFKGIAEIVGKEYMYSGRSKHPALDPFNSVLNFGYTILYCEIIALIKQEKINPFFGIMHYPKNGHASLASDIIEEFRYQIVDSVAINTISLSKFNVNNFCLNTSNNGIYLDKELQKIFISKIIQKINSVHKYNNKEETYKESILRQIRQYKLTINRKESYIYEEFLIR